MTKQCTKCNKVKDLSEFHKHINGVTSHCKNCRLEFNEKFYSIPENYEKKIRNNRKHNLKKKFGITEKDYEVMFNKSFGSCYICGTKDPGRRNKHLSVDHNHKTGKIRGLLCDLCNRGLGYFKDNEDFLLKAVIYLKKEKELKQNVELREYARKCTIYITSGTNY